LHWLHVAALICIYRGKLINQADENTIWGKNRNAIWGKNNNENKWEQILKVVAGPRDESPHAGGAAEGRPTSCGPLVFSASASACIFCFGPILYFLLWPYIVLYFWASWSQKSMFFSFPVGERGQIRLYISTTMVILLFWVRFSKMCSPRRAGERTPKMLKIRNGWVSLFSLLVQ